MIKKIVDYLVDTLIANLVVMVIVIPWYYFTGMPIESVKIVLFSFLTIGWASSFPIVPAVEWVRKRFPYLVKT